MSLRESVGQFLQSRGLRLNTDLGQHFLIDEDILETIIHTADISETDHVLEIGPGIGVLTKELLEHAGNVTTIEFDDRLIPLLKGYLAINDISNQRISELTIIQGNALHVAFPSEPYKIVANIPYHITSPLLRHAFLESGTRPTSMTLLIQREVAENICNIEDAGILTILVALFGKPEIACLVPPKSFLPPPKVDSAVLHISCFDEPKADKETIEEIFKLTKIAFGQKRKMLRNTLGLFQDIAERLSRLGIEQTRRPQTLSVDEWIALTKKD
jgi:16S rRNA (adenine1518-N6/adenine1519-N6)-dimethyltransferase